jgi:hypothetical protein
MRDETAAEGGFDWRAVAWHKAKEAITFAALKWIGNERFPK